MDFDFALVPALRGGYGAAKPDGVIHRRRVNRRIAHPQRQIRGLLLGYWFTARKWSRCSHMVTCRSSHRWYVSRGGALSSDKTDAAPLRVRQTVMLKSRY